MSTIHDQLMQGAPAEGEPPWHGPTGQPYGPQGPPPGRSLRRILAIVIAVALIAIGVTLGSLRVLRGSTVTSAAKNTAPTGGSSLAATSIAEKVAPGLVDVNSTLGYQNGSAAGTGMVLTSSGEVLTNNHVIKGATAISVTDIGNGRTYTATVVGYDEADDIAVLQLQGASGLHTVTLGDSSTVAAGDTVTAIGNAGGAGGTPAAAPGTVTGLGESITATDRSAGTSEQLTGLIRTNADVQAGDSGGPLVNASGQVIGIDTAASSGFQFQAGTTGSSESFAIPVNRAVTIAKQIEAGESSAAAHIGATAFLGVQLATPATAPGVGGPGASANTGATVAGVESGSAAQAAGLTAGDVITSIDGQTVTSASTAATAMESHHPGDSVSISWIDQSGQQHTATATATSGPAG
jgi:S1-C subfamily serine protease